MKEQKLDHTKKIRVGLVFLIQQFCQAFIRQIIFHEIL